jgi:hypothetical protein
VEKEDWEKGVRGGLGGATQGRTGKREPGRAWWEGDGSDEKKTGKRESGRAWWEGDGSDEKDWEKGGGAGWVAG